MYVRVEETEFDEVNHHVEEVHSMTQTQSYIGYVSLMMMILAFGIVYYDSKGRSIVRL